MSLSSPLRLQPVRSVFEATCKHSSPRQLLRQQRRCIHAAPMLSHGDDFQENGIGKLFSPKGFDVAWTQQQTWLAKKLTAMTEGTEDSHAPMSVLIARHARQADKASLFNYASMSYNNHHFFRSLSNTPRPPSDHLHTHLTRCFSSTDSLRRTMIATANAMFGPGFVWLVARRGVDDILKPQLAILTTYNAGSPLPAAHYRAQGIDMATATTNVQAGTSAQSHALAYDLKGAGRTGLHNSGGLSSSDLFSTNKPPGFGGYGGLSQKIAPGGQDLEVLLCVSTWEHAWLQDHGVGGKQRFLEAWWDQIDWPVVDGNWTAGAKSVKQFANAAARSEGTRTMRFDYDG